jgi:hypothetical protein
VALLRTDVSEDRIASIFRVRECEQVTERSCKLLYRHRLIEDCVISQKVIIIMQNLIWNFFFVNSVSNKDFCSV